MTDPVAPLTWARTAAEILRGDAAQVSTRALAWAILRIAPGQCKKDIPRGGETGWDFYVADRDLAELSGLSDKSMRRAKNALVENELLIRVSRGHRTGNGRIVSSVYRLALPGQAPP